MCNVEETLTLDQKRPTKGASNLPREDREISSVPFACIIIIIGITTTSINDVGGAVCPPLKTRLRTYVRRIDSGDIGASAQPEYEKEAKFGINWFRYQRCHNIWVLDNLSPEKLFMLRIVLR
jgi:hypothetical protein